MIGGGSLKHSRCKPDRQIQEILGIPEAGQDFLHQVIRRAPGRRRIVGARHLEKR